MQKKERIAFDNLQVDEAEKNNPKHGSAQNETGHDDFNHFDEGASQDSLDESALEELVNKEAKANDQAVTSLLVGNTSDGLQQLERIEKILEFAASTGHTVDRNLVIVALYNIASVYQSNWTLDKCSKYVDAVIYNLVHSIRHDENLMQDKSSKLTPQQIQVVRAVRFKKLQFLLKLYLQHCAVLSQLSRHAEAIELAGKAQKVMLTITGECSLFCKETKSKIEPPPSANKSNSDKTVNLLNNSGSQNNSVFKDDVPYLKFLADYAMPFLDDFTANIKDFLAKPSQNIIEATKRSLFNWKNNPENNEKYLRKEFKKTHIENEIIDESRNLLGIQQAPKWIETLNIGAVMHMKPMRYKEYAHKRDLTCEITKDALHEKAVYQSLVFFTTATEMRFQELLKEQQTSEGTASPRANKLDEAKLRESLKKSESYHLKAIEIVCRYITGPCPYVNHLITSYQKHYHQDLETIPEESFVVATPKIQSPKATDLEKEYETETFKKMPNSLENIPSGALVKKGSVAKALFVKHESREASKEPRELRESKEFKELKDDKQRGSYDKIRLSSEKVTPVHTRKASEPDKNNSRSINKKSPSFVLTNAEHSSNTSNKSPSNSLTAASLHKIVKGKVSKSPQTKRISTMPDSLEETPLKPASSPHSSRNSNIKSLHVPNLNLNGSTTSRAQNNNKFIKDLSIGGIPGSNTDRLKKKSQIYDSATFRRIETELSGKETPTDSTFFFYKNFDKFIQNLYMQDEKQLRKQYQQETAKKNDERLVPYKKESKPSITKSTLRKSSGNPTQKPSSPLSKPGEVKMRPLLSLDEKKMDIKFDDIKKQYKSSNLNSPTSLARSVQLTKTPRNMISESSTTKSIAQSHFF